VSGEAAVDRSTGEKMLSVAEAPAMPELPPGLGSSASDEAGTGPSPIRYVGDKTFVYNGGVWTDTTFSPESMRPVPVSFGGDDYFAVLKSRPEWGRYFAVGEHLIVVLDGTAYEVREGEAPPLSVPSGEPTEDASTPSATRTPTVDPKPESLLELLAKAIQEMVTQFVDHLVQ
jgi:hypothetical protein